MRYANRESWTLVALVGFLASTGLILSLIVFTGNASAQEEKPPTDHSMFDILKGEYASGPDVTKACLTCHANAATDLMGTTHWLWEYTTESGQQLGKNNVINNYCVAISSNEPRCTSCHVGYGYKDSSFDFTVPENVDCLVCHDTTGTYKKFPTGAGHPTYEEKEFPSGSGKIWTPPDLSAIAQAVGTPSRSNCGSCHFTGGGAPGVKHGDLDPTMANPGRSLDVHMDVDGLNFSCQTCHVTEGHDVAGSRYDISVTEARGNIQTCESCHENAPHENEDINNHADRVACQTCHIPEVAREFPTKMWWDWSTAGKKNDEGRPYQEKDENGWVTYDSKKGSFVWEMNVVPVYQWLNGDTTHIELSDPVDPEGVTNINTLQGDISDPDARIWPVKEFSGIQMYDSVNNTLVVPHLFGPDENAYWKSWDWDKSITAGMESVGAPYSGEYGWTETVMYWPLTHMVAPADNVLECESCHSSEGRLDFVALGYPEDEAAILMSFPPVAPTATTEPTETPVPPTATTTPTEPPEPTKAPTQPPTPTEATAQEESGGSNPTTIGIGLVVVVALGAGGWYLYSRRNQGE
jgi:octaheme c-type cytochrome (tetrathionate reductase family)